MSRPVKIELVDEAAAAGGPAGGAVRVEAELPLPDEVLKIAADVPDRRARLIDLVPVARSICDRIVAMAAAGSEAAGKPISCRKGCNACCSLLLGTSEPEAFCLIEDMKRLPERARSRILDGFVALGQMAEETGLYEALKAEAADPAAAMDRCKKWWRQVRRDCPILRDGACSMYQSRPTACREFLVTSAPALCASYQETRMAIPVRMYQVLARLSDELQGRQTLENFVFLPTLLRWYAGRSTQGERTWRGPMMVERFFETLRRMIEQSRGDQPAISVTFK